MLRDWLNPASWYVPLWVLAGTVMGIIGPHGPVGIGVWLILGAIIAVFAWKASAEQTKQSREIHEYLGKLVDASSSSPTAIISAVAAKILALEARVADLKWRTVTADQRKRFCDAMPKDRRIPMWCVWCAPADAEAVSYAKQVLRMFVEGGVAMTDPGYYEVNNQLSRFDKYGLVLVAKNTDLTEVQILKGAFDAAGVECAVSSEGFEKGSDGFYALRVGPKPEG